jgi:hypothetical protein
LALGLSSQTWKPLGRTLLGTGLILPLLLSGWGDFSLGSATNYDLETRFPAFTALKADRAKGRFLFNIPDPVYPVEMNGQNYGWTFPADSPMVLGIRQSMGYNPIVLTKTQELQKAPPLAYFQMMAVQGIVTDRTMAPSPDFIDQPLGQIHLYALKAPGALAWAPAQVTSLSDEDQVLTAM